MPSNLLPAIVLAGPPHCGKSVLSYLLTMGLRDLGIDHYLLRAAPDGEGDWYLKGEFAKVHPIRLGHKGKFTPSFVAYMINRTARRRVPLLVDIGGAPRDDQWEILSACSHSVLLYQTDDDLQYWRSRLAELNLLPVVELISDLHGTDQILSLHPVLHGKISGLDREHHHTGRVFEALLERMAWICRYERTVLEAQHFQGAEHAILNERALAQDIGKAVTEKLPYWNPEDLPAALAHLPLEPTAIYGRGPVWLAAALSVQTLPASCQLFDVHYGWLVVPEIRNAISDDAKVQTTELPGTTAQLLEFEITNQLLEPQDVISLPLAEGSGGVILSGKLPRWLFAGLARAYAVKRPWVAVHDLGRGRKVVVFSTTDRPALGETLD